MRQAVSKMLLAGAVAFGVLGAVPAQAGDVKSLRTEGMEELNAAPPVADVIEGPRFERSFRAAPPMIPHKIDKYQIDLKANECLRCHDWPYNLKEKATKVSETHYYDRDGNLLGQISGTRWFCTQCHSPQLDAKPLVDNNFKSAAN